MCSVPLREGDGNNNGSTCYFNTFVPNQVTIVGVKGKVVQRANDIHDQLHAIIDGFALEERHKVLNGR